MVYYFIGFLTIVVLFLILVGVVHIRLLNRMALRISYLEGTLDLIYESQTAMNKIIVAYMQNE